MKKRLLGSIIFILCMALFVPLAHAEEVRVTVTATPTELSDTGTVRFTFSISNFSDYELSDLVIVYNGVSYDDLRETIIPPNQSVQDYNLDLQVSESQLGTPIVFTITGVRSGEPISQEATVTIARSSDPVISITRTADAEMARRGDSIKLTYKLSNETKFDMTDIMIIDEDISDTPIRQDNLRAGDSFSLDRQYTMGEDSVVSAPVVTYTVNGKTKSFSGIQPMTLTSLLVQLSMDVQMGAPTAAGVNFTIEVKNTGNQDISGITITDERNNPVNTATFSLKADESTTFSYLVVPVMTEPLRNVKFSLKGTDSLNQPYTQETPRTYEVYPFVDDSQINVTVRAETVTPWSSEAGKLTARIIITNHSSVTLTNVSVSETSMGVLKVYDTLAAGETSFDQEIVLGSPRNLQFSLKGVDPTGASRDLASSMLPVAYGTESTPAPEVTPEATNNASVGALGFLSSTISRVLVVLGVLMVIAFLVLIVLTVIERGKGSLFIRYDDDEDEAPGDELDRIFDDDYAKGYHDKGRDEEEVRSYRECIRTQTTRRTMMPENPVRERRTGERARPQDDSGEWGRREYSSRKPMERQWDEAPVYGRPDRQRDFSARERAAHARKARDLGEQSAILLPAPVAPEIQQPLVRMEYEPDFGMLDPINSELRHDGLPLDEQQPQLFSPEELDHFIEQSVPASELPYQSGMHDDGQDGGASHGPKVIVNRPQPAVRAKTRNEIRRVQTKPNQE